MDLKDWDAPYTSPLRGFLKLVGTVALVVVAVVALVVARWLLVALTAE